MKPSFASPDDTLKIGEFSFILAEAAMKLKILPEAGDDIIVACAFVSISINPLLFKVFILKKDLDTAKSA
jgi:predicted Kef-type K+ transport protein